MEIEQTSQHRAIYAFNTSYRTGHYKYKEINDISFIKIGAVCI